MMNTDFLWQLLAYSAISSTAVLILGALVVRIVRQPADRLRLIQCVLAGCLIAPWLPGLSAWKSITLNLTPTQQHTEVANNSDPASSPISPLPVVTSEPSRSVVAASTPDVLEHNLGTAPALAELPATNAVSSVSPTVSLPTAPVSGSITFARVTNWVVLTYLGAVMAMVVWWLTGLWRRNSLERSAGPASIELQALFARMSGPSGRRVRLLVSDRISGPMTWGLIRPVIIVPERFAQSLDTPHLRWSLAHELSHVERGDVGTLLLASVVQLLCFYQPLYWWVRRQMSLCQDFLADARAARETGSPEDYAAFLVRLAESRLQARLPATLGIIDRKSQLFRRIKMLLSMEGGLPSSCSRAVAISSIMGTAVCLALLSTIQLGADEPTTKPRATATQDSESPATTQAPAPKANEVAPETAKRTEPAFDESKLEEGVVSGVLVKASDGSPVADATVILFLGGSNKTRSDAQGRFRLEKIPPGTRAYPVWAYQGNLVAQKVIVHQLKTGNPAIAKFAPLRLEMADGKQARFTVKSEITGKPIAGATVRFGYPDRRLATTDESGVATVSGLLAENYPVTVEGVDHARIEPRVDLSKAGEVTEFQVGLIEGGIVRGVAVGDDGLPLPEAEVVYRVSAASAFHGDAFRTDSEGSFQHRFLPLNVALEVSAMKKGYLPQSQHVILTKKQRELEIRIKLSKLARGGSIAGIVTDLKKNPIVGAEVTNHGNRSDQRQSVKTDAQGKFVIHDLPTEETERDLYVLAPGFSPQRAEFTPGTAQAPGDVHIVLNPGHTLRGQLKAEGDGSVKGALISARSPDYLHEVGGTTTVEDDGSFEMTSLPADARFDVQLTGYAMLYNIPLELDQAKPITINLESPAVIRGRVLNAKTGKPLSQFRIRIGFCRSSKPSDPRGSYAANWNDPGLTFTSDKGEFQFKPLLNGLPVEMIIEQDGFQRKVIERAVAEKATLAKPLEISLMPKTASHASTLTGQIVDDAGKPKVGVQLRLIVSTEQPEDSNDNKFNWYLIKNGQLAQQSYCEQFLTGVTDSNGRFEFKEIVPERYLQLAYWGTGIPRGKSLAFDETKAGASEDVTIQLPKSATIRGQIDRSKLAKAESVRLMLSAGGGEHAEFKLRDNKDTFEFGDLSPGEYSVIVEAKPVRFVENGNEFSRSSPIAHQKVTIKAGEVKDLSFTELDPVP